MLGARGFSCAVSGFGQVSIVTQALPLADRLLANKAIKACRKKTSSTQGKGSLVFYQIGAHSYLNLSGNVFKSSVSPTSPFSSILLLS